MDAKEEFITHQTLKATDIVGTRVENWEGEDIGVITDVMIHKMHGEVAYLVLSYPGIFGADCLIRHAYSYAL